MEHNTTQERTKGPQHEQRNVQVGSSSHHTYEAALAFKNEILENDTDSRYSKVKVVRKRNHFEVKCYEPIKNESSAEDKDTKQKPKGRKKKK